MDASVVWNGQDPTLSVPSQDDFQQFLDMEINNLSDFDFHDFNPEQGLHDEGSAMDTGMGHGRGAMVHDTTMQEHLPAMTISASQPAAHGPALTHVRSSNESITDLDAQIQYLQHQRQQQQQRQIQEQQRNYYVQNQMVPPTPNSVELHGNAHYYPPSDPQQQAMYERFQRQMKEQEVRKVYFGER